MKELARSVPSLRRHRGSRPAHDIHSGVRDGSGVPAIARTPANILVGKQPKIPLVVSLVFHRSVIPPVKVAATVVFVVPSLGLV